MLKTRQFQGLHTFQTYITDTSLTSPDVFVLDDIPEILTAGKNLIRILGSENLQSNSSVLIEALDNDGNVIYTEVTDYRDAIKRRVISMYVYDTHARGVGQLTLIGMLKSMPDGTPLPAEWKNRHNIKWTRQLFIDPHKNNHTDILFLNPPRVFVTGFKTNSKEISPASLVFNTQYINSSLGLVAFNEIGQGEFILEADSSQGINTKSVGAAQVWSQLEVSSDSPAVTINTREPKSIKQTTSIINGHLIQPGYDVTRILHSAGFSFKSNMIGGIVTVPAPRNVFPTTQSYDLAPGTTASYQTMILDVLSGNTAYARDPYIVSQINEGNVFNTRIKQFSPSSGYVSYSLSNADIQYITSSVVPAITIDMQFAALEPITGDIFRIKTYVKKRNTETVYRLIDDRQMIPNEILIDSYYPNQTTYHDIFDNKRLIGYIYSQGDINRYWLSASVGTGSIDSPATYNVSSLMDSMIISSWVADPTASVTASHDPHTLLYTSSSYTFLEGSQMVLSFRALSEFLATNNTYPEIEIYMTGSAFIPSLPPGNVGEEYHGYGKFIGKITETSTQKYYSQLNFPFTVDRDGYGALLFKVKGGRWFLSRISIKPEEEFGYTPNNIRFQIETDYTISSSVDFKIEYYDYTGKQAQYITYLNNVLLNNPYNGKNYAAAGVTGRELFVIPRYGTASPTDRLHEFDLNRNVTTINGIIRGMKKSDIYTRAAYLDLITNKSSSRWDADIDTQLP